MIAIFAIKVRFSPYLGFFSDGCYTKSIDAKILSHCYSYLSEKRLIEVFPKYFCNDIVLCPICKAFFPSIIFVILNVDLQCRNGRPFQKMTVLE